MSTVEQTKTVQENEIPSMPTERTDLVPIFIMGKRYNVPSTLTIQKAFEYAGYQLIRSCGCRGGICGACATVYRLPDSPKIYVGLACQTVVQPNMYIAMVPFFPANRAVYNLDEISADGKTVSKALPGTHQMHGLQYVHQIVSHGHSSNGIHFGSLAWRHCKGS